MRIKLLTLMILPLMLLECNSSFWIMISKKESKLFSETEKVMLDETTSSINFKYGFDPDIEIDYVFINGKFTDKEITAKSPAMEKILLKHDVKEIELFYEKIIQVREIQVWKMNYFIKKKNWANSNYIQKHILPETELYLGILEKNVIKIDAAYAAELDERKSKIKTNVDARLQKELKEKENNKTTGLPEGF